jgi:hypothetical protein
MEAAAVKSPSVHASAVRAAARQLARRNGGSGQCGSREDRSENKRDCRLEYGAHIRDLLFVGTEIGSLAIGRGHEKKGSMQFGFSF